MNTLLATSIAVLLLTGCASTNRQAASTLPPTAEYAAERGYASRADMSAAVLAARHSKYFPGVARYEVSTVSQNQINILYYDPPGTIVIVKRIHGRWKAVERNGGWQT